MLPHPYTPLKKTETIFGENTLKMQYMVNKKDISSKNLHGGMMATMRLDPEL